MLRESFMQGATGVISFEDIITGEIELEIELEIEYL